MIGSGGPGMMVLAAPFVERNGLIAAARRLTPKLVDHPGVGVGGTNRRLVGRLPFVESGPYRMERPLAAFSQAATGAYARADIAGTIGGSLLRRFTVTYDFRRNRVILEPNPHYSDPPEEYDMSGILMRAARQGSAGTFRLQADCRLSAAEAGVREGDVSVALDGKPLDCELTELARRFKQPGTKPTISVKRNGEILEFRVALQSIALKPVGRTLLPLPHHWQKRSLATDTCV